MILFGESGFWVLCVRLCDCGGYGVFWWYDELWWNWGYGVWEGCECWWLICGCFVVCVGVRRVVGYGRSDWFGLRVFSFFDWFLDVLEIFRIVGEGCIVFYLCDNGELMVFWGEGNDDWMVGVCWSWGVVLVCEFVCGLEWFILVNCKCDFMWLWVISISILECFEGIG